MVSFCIVDVYGCKKITESRDHRCPVWARERCRISPPRFLAECCKRQLKQGSFVLLYFRLFTFLICMEFVYLYFPVLFCLSVSVKWLSVKTASEMTYIVSSGALNSIPTNVTIVNTVLCGCRRDFAPRPSLSAYVQSQRSGVSLLAVQLMVAFSARA